MDTKKKQPALLYLDTNGFYFFGAGTISVISMGFLPEAVKDMDVINASSLENQIKAFSEQSNIAPSSISVIVSPNLIFEKEIQITDIEKQKAEVQHFIDNLPFENVASLTLPAEKGIKVLATNEDLFLSLNTSFLKVNSSIEIVILYNSLGADGQLINNLTPDNANMLIKKIDRLKQFNLLKQRPKTPLIQQAPDESKNETQTSGISTSSPPKKSNTRTYVMVGFLLVLLGVLGYMLLNLNKFQ